VQIFFENHRVAPKKAVRAMITVLEYLRGQTHPQSKTMFDNNFWLEIDYLAACEAALSINNPRVALLFYEIWASSKEAKVQSDVSLNILLDIYRRCDADGFDGVIAMLEPTDDHIRLQYQQERAWMKSLNIHETTLSLRKPDENATIQSLMGFSQSMLNMGLNYLLTSYLNGSSNVDPRISDMQLEALWRCGQWDFTNTAIFSAETPRNLCIYEALRNIRKGAIETAQSHVIKGLSLCANEMDTYYQNLSISNSHGIRQAVALTDLSDVLDESGLHSQWEKFLLRLSTTNAYLMDAYAFNDIEYTLACRLKSLDVLTHNEEKNNIYLEKPSALTQYTADFLLQYAKLARKSNNIHHAQYALGLLKSRATQGQDLDVSLEEVKLLWTDGSQNIAIRRLRTLLVPLRASNELKNEIQRAKLSCLLARWTDQNRLEAPKGILELFRESAFSASLLNNQLRGEAKAAPLPTLEKLKQGKLIGSCFFYFAQFADKCYQNQLTDENHGAMIELLEAKKRELLSAKESKLRSKGDISLRRLAIEIKLDEQEKARFERSLTDYLTTSMKYYIHCLEACDKWDLSVFRLCSLWFSNATSTAVNGLMAGCNIPTRKFIGLMYQLSARMQTDQNDFQKALKQIIFGMVQEHPFHSLYQLIALKNGAADKDGKPLKDVPSVNVAAAELLNQAKSDQQRNELINAMDYLSDGYIELARLQAQPPPATKTVKGRQVQPSVPIDRRMKISGVRDLSVPIITVDIPADKSKRYRGLATIQTFQKEYKLVGGINAPKVVSCHGSDGKSYTQV
jgi:ataxia telangiectasia mutated family protein